MPILMPCSHCGQKYELSDTLAGKKVRCKACAQIFRVLVPSRPTPVTNARPRRALSPSPRVEKPPALDPRLVFDLEDEEESRLDPAEAALRRAAGFEHLGDDD
jgi:DNA-directed RNA polymerase subunit RPC12/RpoP